MLVTHPPAAEFFEFFQAVNPAEMNCLLPSSTGFHLRVGKPFSWKEMWARVGLHPFVRGVHFALGRLIWVVSQMLICSHFAV